jgi:hypothetical protein
MGLPSAFFPETRLHLSHGGRETKARVQRNAYVEYCKSPHENINDRLQNRELQYDAIGDIFFLGRTCRRIEGHSDLLACDTDYMWLTSPSDATVSSA